jgi:tRNA modification GTPase
LALRRDDTIAALATAPGVGAIAVLRLTGPKARAIARDLTGRDPQPRVAELRTLRDASGAILDRGLVLFFPGPSSFTGEDVVELHCHGGRVVSDAVLATAYKLGARPAEAGEFTLRAFLNDKIDLVQAEAIADLITSGSEQAARAAVRSLEGEFSSAVTGLQQALTKLRVRIEAWLDFPEEELPFDAAPECAAELQALVASLEELRTRARSGRALRDGLSVAIAGPPNAGKSSLLNRLAGYDAAIVTEIPGTTRDPLREHLVLDGLPVTVVDTAGLRDTSDPVEREGVRRARLGGAFRCGAPRPLALGGRRPRAACRDARSGARSQRRRRRGDGRRQQDRSRRRDGAATKRAGHCDRLRLRLDGGGHRLARRALEGSGRARRRDGRHVQRAAPTPRCARTRARRARRSICAMLRRR